MEFHSWPSAIITAYLNASLLHVAAMSHHAHVNRLWMYGVAGTGVIAAAGAMTLGMFLTVINVGVDIASCAVLTSIATAIVMKSTSRSIADSAIRFSIADICSLTAAMALLLIGRPHGVLPFLLVYVQIPAAIIRIATCRWPWLSSILPLVGIVILFMTLFLGAVEVVGQSAFSIGIRNGLAFLMLPGLSFAYKWISGPSAGQSSVNRP